MNEEIGLRQLLDYYYVLISDDLLLIRDRVQKELKELGLWKFAGAIMYIMQEVFGMPASRLIVPPNEKYGRFVLNEVLEAGNGTSSGDLNTGGNLSESSFLEALFGLEFGHADFADFCPMRAGISQMMQMTQIFFCSSSITHHDLLEEFG